MITKFIDSLYNAILMKYYDVSVGKNFRCDGRLIVQGHGKYSFGDNVRIISKESINPVGGVRLYSKHWMGEVLT